MKSIFSYGFLIVCLLGTLLRPAPLSSADLTSAKDTLQTSRLSVYARVDSSGTAAGASNVKVQASASAPANTITTANLNIGDTLTIGASTDAYYTVVGIVDSLNFTVSPVLAAGDADNNDVIYRKVKPQHSVTFTTKTAVANGFFQILLPSDATTPNDGKPDDQGYDFNTTVTVTAPSDVGATYDFVTGVATAAGGTYCTSPANYHCFEVHYSGVGSIGQAFTITLGNTNGTNTPIAPAPGDTTEATAETYPVLVKNFGNQANPSTATPIDKASVKIALIEAVRVTATVDPTISMTICGADTCHDIDPADVKDGETLSNNTGATSTGLSVSLGTLDLLAARLEAQKITIATNGSGGYALTAIDDGNLREGSNTIDDNVAAADPATPAVLNTVGTEAYGIHVCGTHVEAATWGTGTDTCGGGPTTNEYSGTDSTQALPLVSYTTGPTAGVDTYVLYKANISPITAQGDYAHSISYIATATF
ncbi:MAG: hypothetical protein UX21_C0014G0006 [Microgenomates group bacterium GW2011_GWC2_45_8]|nr:MAG: hypothetical protein UX21_C0014G0006 [Microgenomates group bacterium GW2011_GWC2_45_8]